MVPQTRQDTLPEEVCRDELMMEMSEEWVEGGWMECEVEGWVECEVAKF